MELVRFTAFSATRMSSTHSRSAHDAHDGLHVVALTRGHGASPCLSDSARYDLEGTLGRPARRHRRDYRDCPGCLAYPDVFRFLCR